MKKLKLIYSLVLLTACFFNKAAAQSVQVIARLDQTTIKIGEQTKLNFIVHQPAKERVNFPQIADSIAKIQIVSASKIDTAYDESRTNITLHKSYVITVFDAGSYT